MNTNATAQMVTSGGKGCMKQRLDIDQIAAEAADDFDRYLSNGVPDYYIMSEEDKASLKDIIKAIIEKATEGARDENTAHQLTITKLEGEIIELKTARQLARGIQTTEYAKGWDDHVAAVRSSHAAHASGQDESKAKSTARAIRSIAERAGLKITDDVELAWRDAILYALPAAHASEPMHCPHCNASFLPPKT